MLVNTVLGDRDRNGTHWWASLAYLLSVKSVRDLFSKQGG